jgi:hypothetical protein
VARPAQPKILKNLQKIGPGKKKIALFFGLARPTIWLKLRQWLAGCLGDFLSLFETTCFGISPQKKISQKAR